VSIKGSATPSIQTRVRRESDATRPPSHCLRPLTWQTNWLASFRGTPVPKRRIAHERTIGTLSCLGCSYARPGRP
jgi:hypothetical protein